MSDLTTDAAQEVLAAKRATASVKDRQTRMACQRLCHALDNLIREVELEWQPIGASSPPPGTVPAVPQSVFNLERCDGRCETRQGCGDECAGPEPRMGDDDALVGRMARYLYEELIGEEWSTSHECEKWRAAVGTALDRESRPEPRWDRAGDQLSVRVPSVWTSLAHGVLRAETEHERRSCAVILAGLILGVDNIRGTGHTGSMQSTNQED